MKPFNVMTSNLVAAREGSIAREIGTKLLIGNFNDDSLLYGYKNYRF